MKDLTKLFCDLISFGSGIERYSGDIQTAMSSLAGIVLNEDVCEIGKLDYDAIREHIESLRSAQRGSDYDIDIHIKKVVTNHGRMGVILNTGRELTFDERDIIRY